MAASSKPPPQASTITGTSQVFHYGQTDHLYLAPSFYYPNEKAFLNGHLNGQSRTVATPQANGDFTVQSPSNGTFVESRQSIGSLNGSTKATLVTESGERESACKFRSEPCEESLSSYSDLWTGDQEEPHVNGNHCGQAGSTASKGPFEYDAEEEYDEDSNDTRSCSSSSGCSSSSNSMVGSVNRHLSLNNPQYHRTPVSTTTSASGKNGSITTSSAGATSQYKDLTPKQVCALSFTPFLLSRVPAFKFHFLITDCMITMHAFA